MKISEVIDALTRYHKSLWNGIDFKPDDRRFDGVKFGDPEQECTGITVTCFASMEVIRKTAELGYNFIITHEPTFFHNDEVPAMEPTGNSIFELKRKYMTEHNIVVFREHDMMHGPDGFNLNYSERLSTDMIFYGFMKVMGWEKYLFGAYQMPVLFRMPEGTTAKDIARQLMDRLHMNGVRVLGDINAPCRTLYVVQHIDGWIDMHKLKIIEETDADVLIPLEVHDETISEYIRDSCSFGRPRAILEIGHFNGEEPGMQYMAETWLPELLGPGIPVKFIQSGDAFSYYS